MIILPNLIKQKCTRFFQSGCWLLLLLLGWIAFPLSASTTHNYSPGCNFKNLALTLTVDITSEDVSCNGLADGSATATASGGTAPYNYVWNNNDTGATISNLSAGTYFVTVTDALGEVGVDSVIINELPPLTATTNANFETCEGSQDAEASVFAQGGTHPFYTYQWDDPQQQTTFDATNLSAGDYNVTVTDQNGCTLVASVTVEISPEGVWIMTNSTPVSCLENDGTAYVNPMTGTAPFTFLWSNGDTTANPQNLTEGQYFVTVTDVNGCSAVDSTQVGVLPELEGFVGVTNATCDGISDGSATITAFNGTPPYTYQWSDPAMQTTVTATGLAAGLYMVTVTDANGCTIVRNGIVKNDIEIDVDITSTDASCGTVNNGTATAMASGGTDPYTYEWSNGGTTATIDSLAPGIYVVTATDANGCMAVDSVEIMQGDEFVTTITTENVNCDSSILGEATVTVVDGTAPYVIEWTVDSTVIVNTSDTINTITGLLPGQYSVTVTDANNCTSMQDFSIEAEPDLDVTANGTPPNCDTCQDGSITVTVTNGTMPFEYEWNTGDTTSFLDSVGIGTYIVTVTDANGCSGTDTITFPPDPMFEIDVTPSDEVCLGDENGSAQVTVNGGTPPFTFEWSCSDSDSSSAVNLPPGNCTVTVTDADGNTLTETFTINPGSEVLISGVVTNESCDPTILGSIDLTVSGGTPTYDYDWNDDSLDGTEDPNGLTSGTYIVTVTDQDGCTAVDTFIVDAENIELSHTTTPVPCDSSTLGTIDLTVIGGTPPYSYDWSEDAFDGQEDPTDVNPGTYFVTVTDTLGCTAVDTIEVGIDAIEIGVDATAVACDSSNLGSIDLTITGGTPPYTFDWDDDTLDGQEDPSGLGSGTYIVTVSDTTGCETTDTIVVENESIDIILDTLINVSCDGLELGSIELTIEGGTPPYVYDWNDDDLDGQEDIDSLTEGTYILKVTDSLGCMASDTFEIGRDTITIIVIDTEPVACDTSMLGSIDLDVSGGNPPYTFDWNDDSLDGEEDPDSLFVGDYIVTVTDAEGCTSVSDTITIDFNMLMLDWSTTPVSCDSSVLGSIDLTVLNGMPPYTYDWDDDSLDGQEDPSGLPAGTYVVTVTDAKNCVASDTIEVGTDQITIEVETIPVACDSSNLGSIDLTVSGGNPPYTFDWNDDTLDGQEDPSGLGSGTYIVTVSDTTGCETTDTIVVENESIDIILDTLINVSCDGLELGSIELTIEGGTPPYVYDWNDDDLDGQEDIDSLTEGTYILKVTDSLGCMASDTFEIGRDTITIIVVDTEPVACDTSMLGSIDLDVSGGNPPYTFDWNDDSLDGEEDPDSLFVGTYIVTVTDIDGCTSVSDTIFIDFDSIDLEWTTIPVSCDSTILGSIDLEVIGGTPPYTYDWDNDDLDGIEDPDSLGVGIYVVTVTDAKSCTATDTIPIETDSIVITLDPTNISCDSSTLGSIDLTVEGGVPPYDFDWSDDSLDGIEDPTGLEPGIYSITVTGAKGCSAVDTTIIEVDSLTLTWETTPVSCDSSMLGTIDLTVEGGTPPYAYDWEDDSLDGIEDPTGLGVGDYPVTVTDSLGCSASDTITIEQDTITIIVVTTPVACDTSNLGSINLEVVGGVEPYDFDWNIDSLDGQQNPDSLFVGTYIVTVSDSTGCSTTDTIMIDFDMIMVDADPTPVSCDSLTLGSIDVTVTGGTEPYIYIWNDTTLNGIEDPDSLDIGTYIVMVVDSNNCMATDTAIVGIDTLPDADFSFDFEACSLDSTTIQFTDETLDPDSSITSWVWIFNGSDSAFVQNPVYTTDDTLLNVVLFIFNEDGCSDSTSQDIPINNIVINIQDTLIACPGDTITLNEGGDTTLQYEWMVDGMVVDTVPSPVITPDSSVTYTVTITSFSPDTCEITLETFVFVPPPVMIDMPNDTLICDPEITLSGPSDTLLSYMWLNSEGDTLSDSSMVTVMPSDTTIYILMATDTFNCGSKDTVTIIGGSVDVVIPPVISVCVGDTLQLNAVNLDTNDVIQVYNWIPDSLFSENGIPDPVFLPTDSVGEYEVILETQNQYLCKSTDTTQIIVLDSTSNGGFLAFVQCEDSTVTFINNNAPHFTLYYDSIVTDTTPFSTGKISTFTYPGPGIYTVTLVADSLESGCHPDTIQRQIEVFEEPLYDFGFDWSLDNCTDSALVVITDTSSHVTDDIINWDWTIEGDSLGVLTDTVQNPSFIVTSSQTIILNLEVETSLGCMAEFTDTIMVELIELDLQDMMICPGDTVALNPNGNPDYQYSWAPDSSLVSSADEANPLANPLETTTYFVTVTSISDDLQDTCEVVREVTIDVSMLSSLTVSDDDIICEPQDVQIQVTAANATQITWATDISFDPGSIIGNEDTITVTPEEANNVYYVTVVDANGCAQLDSVTINNFEVQVGIIEDTTVCLGDVVPLAVQNLIPGDDLTYIWTGDYPFVPVNADSSTIEVVADQPGEMQVEISNNECVFTTVVTIDVDEFANLPIISADPDTIFVSEESRLNVENDDLSWTYLWTPNGSLDFDDVPNPTATPAETTTYNVEITNENQCVAERTVTVVVIPTRCEEPFIFIPNAFSPNGDGLNDELFVRGLNIANVYLAVYNRWGQKVFESTSLFDGWDGTFKGKALAPDVYGYYLEVDCGDGQTFFKKGNVTLLR